ncbi:metalloregulator ArsR/SmtB family transcription factor [Candidatus Aquicultor secundus]|nr:metalloregulator ArsR/SmtB family transcription factor [Candidatus Aquicultor secundus]
MLYRAMPEGSILKNYFKALANPARLEILSLLSNSEKDGGNDVSNGHGELSVCKIIESIPLSPSTISHHLNVLKEADLVKSRKDKQWIYYSLNRETINKIRGSLSNL